MASSGEVEREAAALLRAILELVAAGELIASTPQAIALVRRIEGSAAALEEAAKASRAPRRRHTTGPRSAAGG